MKTNMNKTEMYNKIINAIDVLSRVEGEEVDRIVVENNYERQEREIYHMGEISVMRKGRRLCLLVDSVDITDKVERLDVIHKTLIRIYENQQKKKEADKLGRAESYLNSFVGK